MLGPVADRLGLRRDRSVPWPPEASIGWGIGAVVLAFLTVQVMANFWYTTVVLTAFDSPVPPPEDQPIWILPATGVALWVGYLAAPWVLRRLLGGEAVDFELGLTPIRGLVGLGIGIGFQLLLLPMVYFVVLRLFPDQDPSGTAQALMDRVDGPIDVALLLFVIVIAAPVAEEWFYRGLLLPAVSRRHGFIVGAVVSSVVFTLVHIDPITFPGLFPFAMALAWLARWGGLGTAIVAHMAFNGATAVLLLANS